MTPGPLTRQEEVVQVDLLNSSIQRLEGVVVDGATAQKGLLLRNTTLKGAAISIFIISE
jgi:hypothetical protein